MTAVLRLHDAPAPTGAEKSQGHARVPNEIARGATLSLQAIGLYAVLASFAGSKGTCYPSLQLLAKLGCTTVNRVRRVIAELERSGLVVVDHGEGRRNHYHLTTPPLTTDSPSQNDGATPPETTADPIQNEQGTTTNPIQNEQAPCPKWTRTLAKMDTEEVLRRSINEEGTGEDHRDKARSEDRDPAIGAPPDLDAVLGHAGMIGLGSEEARKFFFWYEARRWDGVRNWKSLMQYWKINGVNRSGSPGASRSGGGPFT